MKKKTGTMESVSGVARKKASLNSIEHYDVRILTFQITKPQEWQH